MGDGGRAGGGGWGGEAGTRNRTGVLCLVPVAFSRLRLPILKHVSSLEKHLSFSRADKPTVIGYSFRKVHVAK